MQKIDFEEAIDGLVAKDPRYPAEAYSFVRAALDFTVRLTRKGNTTGPFEDRHVSGEELVIGIRRYALKEFGPMVPTVFREWGISECSDFGEIVFNLIESGVLGRTDSDRREDFAGHYDFDEAFVQPFLPKKAAVGG